MDEPEFCSEHINADDGTWEYDGDTGIIVYPNLFSDELIVPSPDRQEGTDLSLASSDDGAFTTITNLGEANIRAKSKFEVVELDASSCCASDYARSAYDGTTDNSEAAGDDAMLNWALSSGDGSPRTKSSFPEGSIVLDLSQSGPSDVKGGYGLSPSRQGIIIQDDDQDPCACDRSTALSSLTCNDSVFPLKLFVPKDRIGVVFDPFLEAKRPPPSSAPYGKKRFSTEIVGLNRFISSTRNLPTIFRPQSKWVRPDLHMHRAQSSSVLPTSCPPELLVITTTHSHLTPSVCSTSSGDDNRSLARAPSLTSNDSHIHSISQLFTNELRERYPTAVLRSYQRYYYPSFSLSKASLDDGYKRKRRRLFLLILCLASLLAGLISIIVFATGRDDEIMSNRLSELSSIVSAQGNGSLPNACCIQGMGYLDQMSGNIDNDEEDAEGITGVGNAKLGDENSSSGDISYGGIRPIVSLASSQYSDPLSSHTSHGTAVTSSSPPSPSSQLNPTALMEDDFSAKLFPLTDAPTNFATVHPSFHHTMTQIYSNAHPPTILSSSDSTPSLNVDVAPNHPQPTTIKRTPRPNNQPSTWDPRNQPTKRPRQRPQTKQPSERPSPFPVVPLPSTDPTTDVPTLSQIEFPTFVPTVLPPIVLNETQIPSLPPSDSKTQNETGSQGTDGLTDSPSVDATPYSPTSSPITPKDDSTSSPTNIGNPQPSTSHIPSPSPFSTLKPSYKDIFQLSTSPTVPKSSVPNGTSSQMPTSKLSPHVMSPSLAPITLPTSNLISARTTLEPSSTPTFQLTPPRTPDPNPEPTPQRTPEPTPQPTPEPTPQPTPEPTPQPTPEPTPQPTPEPTPQPTPEPTPQPTPEPTPQPTPEPTPQPSFCRERPFYLSGDSKCTNLGTGVRFYDTLTECCEVNFGSLDACPFFDVCRPYRRRERKMTQL